MVRTAIGLHGHQAGFHLGEKRDQPSPGESFLENRIPLGIHSVDLENGFGSIKADHCNLFHGRPSSFRVNNAFPVWRRDVPAGRRVHVIRARFCACVMAPTK
jgi:hypothetical protein